MKLQNLPVVYSVILLIAPCDPAAAGEPAAAQQAAALRREIARHDQRYFVHAEPLISDAAYDALGRRLEELAGAEGAAAVAGAGNGGPDVLPDDSTGRFENAGHLTPALGLKKVRSMAELGATYDRWTERLGEAEPAFWLEPKVDGMAVSVVYEQGRLARVVARGDGRRGEVLTDNLRAAGCLPEQLAPWSACPDWRAWPDVLELRGEAYIPLASFAALNMERLRRGEQPYATARNLAAGSLRLTEPAAAAQRDLRVVLFGWGAWEPERDAPASHGDFRRILAAWGLPILADAARGRGAVELMEAVAAMEAGRGDWEFATDGLVVKLDSVADQQALGSGPTAPGWAVALKFAPPTLTTRLVGIDWQLGRTGLLTPVAELEPVTAGGRTIRRANLHNRDFVTGGDYRIGDTVRLELAGDIIPSLLGVVLRERPAGATPCRLPVLCPACGAVLDNDPADPFLRCPAAACPGKL